MRCLGSRSLRFLVLIACAAVAPREARAQLPSPSSIEQQLIGSWEGLFQSDHVAPGPLRLVVARDSAWRVRIMLRANDQDFSTESSEATLEGNILSWRHETMGQDCRGRVVLEDGTLTGETTCGEGGLSFMLTRVPPARGGHHE